MSLKQNQNRLERNGQHKNLPLAGSQRRYPSLWLTCSHPVMDQALALARGLDSALVCRSLGTPTAEHSRWADVSLDLIETAVRHQRIVQIIVCGHADCSSVPKLTDQVNPGRKTAREKLLSGVCQTTESNLQGQKQVLERMRALQQSPLLAASLSQGALTIHGLFYLAESGAFAVYNVQSGQFVPATF